MSNVEIIEKKVQDQGSKVTRTEVNNTKVDRTEVNNTKVDVNTAFK